MLLEQGEVVAVDGDAVWVETLRRSTCGSCAAQKGCGHGLLNRVGGQRRQLIRVLPGKVLPRDCRVGDAVTLALPESVVLRGSLLVYLLPLVALLLGAGLGSTLVADQGGDLPALAGGLLGFAAGLYQVRLHARRHRDDPALQPTLHARSSGPVQVLDLG